jgi:hypothetical protein
MDNGNFPIIYPYRQYFLYNPDGSIFILPDGSGLMPFDEPYSIPLPFADNKKPLR